MLRRSEDTAAAIAEVIGTAVDAAAAETGASASVYSSVSDSAAASASSPDRSVGTSAAPPAASDVPDAALRISSSESATSPAAASAADMRPRSGVASRGSSDASLAVLPDTTRELPSDSGGAGTGRRSRGGWLCRRRGGGGAAAVRPCILLSGLPAELRSIFADAATAEARRTAVSPTSMLVEEPSAPRITERWSSESRALRRGDAPNDAPRRPLLGVAVTTVRSAEAGGGGGGGGGGAGIW